MHSPTSAYQPQTLYGLRVAICAELPKMKLAPGNYVTPAYRAEIDAWLVDFFGTTPLLPDGQVVRFGDIISMNLRTFIKVKKELKGSA